ncbi:P1 family peptidase [Tannockella kyphosi]|uniref:P1 family peptidase n=1 Tax=Tannockella kyphosi TaxID=2899121 RepID=UPI0020115E83|nr:P1 family peptidase [Tannockella kyphosi]
MKQISMHHIQGIQIGQSQNLEAGTGCTAILCPKGATAGVDVRGGGPATRETDLLNPKNMVQQIHGVMFSGGSAFGLDAASGAMEYLDKKEYGFEILGFHVPIVCGASLFDLGVGDGSIRPDKQMGYEACVASETNTYQNGNFGAGTGACVGKMSPTLSPMKTGQGMYGVEAGGIQVCAYVALNAIGNVSDGKGSFLAGMHQDGIIIDPLDFFSQGLESITLPQGNTTIGCVVTNAKLDKSQCNKVASITHNGYALSIFPVHTMSDGDTIFVLSTGQVEASVDAIGVLATTCMKEAIHVATKTSTPSYGLESYQSIKQ